jgi:hypothetical protein
MVQSRAWLGHTVPGPSRRLLARSASEGPGYLRLRVGLVCPERHPVLNRAQAPFDLCRDLSGPITRAKNIYGDGPGPRNSLPGLDRLALDLVGTAGESAGFHFD